MPTLKKHFVREGSVFVKDGLTAYQLKEQFGSLKDMLVSDKESIKSLIESAVKKKVKCSADMQAMLDKPNTALIKVIQCGWSMNGNYYDQACLQKLPAVMEAQGPIQFLNHLEEDDASKLDRSWEEIVSFTKAVWYDEVTEAVYSIVRFPREKQDTGWIFNLIQDEPSMVGVSIDSAVYIQEDYEADGMKGDKIMGWAFFNSADYVIFASAGGVAIEANAVKEKIKSYKIKESQKVKTTKEQIDAKKEQLKKMRESIDSFLTKYYDNQAYHEIRAVIESLDSFMMDIWWDIYDEETTPEQRLSAIKVAFEQASTVLQGLEFWKNPGAEYDATGKVIPPTETKQESNKLNLTLKTKESQTMTLAEFKAAHPEAYVQLSLEAKTLATAELTTATQESVTSLTKQVSTLDAEVVAVKAEKLQLQTQLDTYKSKEAVQAKKEAVQSAIDAAGFTPAEKEIAITVNFVKTLEAMSTPEEITASLEDRKTLVSKTQTAVAIEGEAKPPKPDNKKESVIDDKIIADAFSEITA